MALRPVGFAAVRVALHRGARSRGYKLLRERERADPRSLVSGDGGDVVLIGVGSNYGCLIARFFDLLIARFFDRPLTLSCLPFYSF
jgi:hypothetical protein